MAAGLIQRSFAGGEIAPALYGRADQTKYQTGLKTCRNFRVKKHGGAENRAGLQHVNEVKTSSLATYLIKFVFNDEQSYLIEVGNLYMRFYRNPSPYTSPARIVVSGVAAYNGATTYAMADLVSYGGVNYYSKVDSNTGNQPDISPTQWYALTGTIYEIPTPYATADLSRLQFFQSGDVVTILHQSYAPRELTRTGHTAWKLQSVTYAPSNSAPSAGLTVTAPGAGATTWRYKLTSVKSETYEESLPSAVMSDTGDAASASNTHTLAWTAVSGQAEYNVYMEYPLDSGTYCFIGVATTNAFSYNGATPDTSITPPVSRDPFSGATNQPATGAYYQQRLVQANSTSQPEKIFASRSAMFKNFSISSPLQDDDAVTFTIAGNKVAEVRHIIDLGVMVVLTASGEYIVQGNADGVLSATEPANPVRVGTNGASYVPPALVNDSLVFLQARGNVIRDLRLSVAAEGQVSSYKGRDLTVYAGHLFKNKSVTRIDYAQIPDSIIWAVRSDGTLLGLTYLPEHEVWGWHRHDTDGTFEDVCVIPEGGMDAVYCVVKRTINGTTKRYIERFASRDFTDIRYDAYFADSFLIYDGRNTGSTTLTLSTAGGWTINDTITITASAAQFVAGDVGNDYELTVGTSTVRIRVVTFTSTTVVSGTPSMTVPTALRNVATSTWTRCVDDLSGLDHLEAKAVAVFGDGFVVANPNNPSYSTITVSAGAITLDRPYGVIYVGLPYICDFKTLDLDIHGQNVRSRMKNITHVELLVEDSRGVWAGPRLPEDIPSGERVDSTDILEGLAEFQPSRIVNYGDQWPLENGLIEIPIASTWNNSGGFAVRQVDQLPLTILSAIPSGQMGG